MCHGTVLRNRYVYSLVRCRSRFSLSRSTFFHSNAAGLREEQIVVSGETFAGCYAAEPSSVQSKIITEERDVTDCAYRCYVQGWNDLGCIYFKEPGCAGFDW